MPFAVYVEWINGSKAERLFKQRRTAAISMAREIDPDCPESEIVTPEAEDSWWDWVWQGSWCRYECERSIR